jgi:putative ABC transport system permease protein
MLRNYLQVAFRHLRKHKGATFIKLAGLSIGMASCMLILLYVADELSYNRFNTRYTDLYRVNFVKDEGGDKHLMANAPIPFGPVIAQDVPQVERVGRFYNRGGIMETGTDQGGGTGGGTLKFQEPNVYFADSSVLDMFTFHFIEGSAATALSDPGGVVLTDEMAKKYFGGAPALGKTLEFEHKVPLRVTAVVEKWPATSDEQFDFLIPFETNYSVETKPIADFLRSNWLYNPTDMYVLLHHGATIPSMKFLSKKYGDERVAKGYYVALQPLSKVHLYSSDIEGSPSNSNIRDVYIFGAIALLILLIANINFINLSNAQSLTRIGEIGIRKVTGADNRHLILQFLGEGLVLSFVAFVAALGITALGLPALNGITGQQIRLTTLLQPGVLGAFAALFILTGLLAGLYPAMFITRFGLAFLVKGKSFIPRSGGRVIREGLIVTQFTIAVALIIGALVINRQLQYLRTKPLGFRKDQVLSLPLFGTASSPLSNGVDSSLRSRANAFENDIRAYSAVQGVTLASNLPGNNFPRGLVIPEGHKEQDNIFLPWTSVDYNFIETMGLEVVAGRGFSKAAGTDNKEAFVINESAVRLFGWKSSQDAIGKTMIRGDQAHGKRGRVIGVVRDFHFSKLDQPLQPMIMDVNVPRFTTFAVIVQPSNIPATIDYLRKAWDKAFPDLVFGYTFLDQDIDAQYKAQENLSKLVGYFAGIAIFLALIGIFSLASFIAIRRTREIGIRKVLGADTGSIVALLFRDFQRLVLVALVLALPLAWFLMNRWLHDFAYRTHLSWWIFVVAALGTLGLTWVTVGWQGFRAARANPVDSLRVE